MIINGLGKQIIIDEIRNNATASEVYFLSRLLDNELISISEDWPGRIYTSQFIYDILIRKTKVHPKCLRILVVNVAVKLKWKDKLIWVTMFESEKLNNSVMFYFNDSIKTYLYTGAFHETSRLFRNECFMLCVEKGIDYVYIDTTLCKSNPYICTDDTIDEIKKISLKHPHSKLALIIPNFGYEKLLTELVKAFPQKIYPTKTQRYVLTKLGYKDYISPMCQTSRIIVLLPGISTEDLETDVIIIYITVGDSSKKNNDFCAYQRQWSPLPSLMDLQVLLEMIRPNKIIPIKQDPFNNNLELPFHFKWLAKETSREEVTPDLTDRISIESWPENNCNETFKIICSSVEGSQNDLDSPSLPATKEFHIQDHISKKSTPEKCKDASKPVKQECNQQMESKLQFNTNCTDLTTKRRTRIIRRASGLNFFDSDEDK